MSTRLLLIAEIAAMCKRGWTPDKALERLLLTSEVYCEFYDGLTADGQKVLRTYIREQTEAKRG